MASGFYPTMSYSPPSTTDGGDFGKVQGSMNSPISLRIAIGQCLNNFTVYHVSLA